jgi:hypothetical protein
MTYKLVVDAAVASSTKFDAAGRSFRSTRRELFEGPWTDRSRVASRITARSMCSAVTPMGIDDSAPLQRPWGQATSVSARSKGGRDATALIGRGKHRSCSDLAVPS